MLTTKTQYRDPEQLYAQKNHYLHFVSPLSAASHKCSVFIHSSTTDDAVQILATGSVAYVIVKTQIITSIVPFSFLYVYADFTNGDKNMIKNI